MTVTVASFIQDFPEFSDASRFPIATINFYLNLAQDVTASWADFADYGAQLYIAHNLVLESRAMQVSAFGGQPGTLEPIITGKSVGGVSKTGELGPITIDGAGQWNSTNYGVRFYMLCQIVGAGGLQL